VFNVAIEMHYREANGASVGGYGGLVKLETVEQLQEVLSWVDKEYFDLLLAVVEEVEGQRKIQDVFRVNKRTD
jgi:hypothetical protein